MRIFSRLNLDSRCRLGLLAAALALAGCGRGDADAGAGAVQPTLEVRVATLAPETLDLSLTLAGTVEPVRSVVVSAEVEGVLRGFARADGGGPLAEGDTLAAGEVFARLEDQPLKARYDAARAEAEFAAGVRRRLEQMRAAGDNLVADEEYEQAVARATATAAARELARIDLERSRLKAPAATDGVERFVLEEQLAEPGEFIGRGRAVARLVNLDRVRVAVQVSERDIVFLRPGAPVERVTITGWLDQPDREIAGGRIVRLARVADPRSRTFTVEVELPNAPDPADGFRLRGGMIVRVTLQLRRLENVITVPLAALIPGGEAGQAVVFVVSEGRAERRQVAPGVFSGDRVEIRQGLAAGEQLIVSGHKQAEDGRPVSVLP